MTIAYLAKPLMKLLDIKVELTWPTRLKYYHHWIRDEREWQDYWIKRLERENVYVGLKGPNSVFYAGSDIKWH